MCTPPCERYILTVIWTGTQRATPDHQSTCNCYRLSGEREYISLVAIAVPSWFFCWLQPTPIPSLPTPTSMIKPSIDRHKRENNSHLYFSVSISQKRTCGHMSAVLRLFEKDMATQNAHNSMQSTKEILKGKCRYEKQKPWPSCDLSPIFEKLLLFTDV